MEHNFESLSPLDDDLFHENYTMSRLLEEEEEEAPAPLWEVIFTCVTVITMFLVLMTDRVATDCVMLTALTAFYVSGIIEIKEALAGFSSQGLLTVLALFAVAEGLNKTGALHYYVGRLLGHPRTISEAQLRVMVPISILSGFINDTPLVTVALPSVIAWSRKIQIHPRYLLIPLSYSALLGGVCTLIGTSTNLVIAGLLQDRYPDNETFQSMSLFALGKYGVPVTFAGIAYVLLATPWLLAKGGLNDASASVDDMFNDLLLGCRLTPWSPAAGRTVQRSGLRDTGGIYLVRVKRASTGNVHHAVGPDFVLEVGDILYFTGLVETFGEFCAEHGLEVVTNEVDHHHPQQHSNNQDVDVDAVISGMSGSISHVPDDEPANNEEDALLLSTSFDAYKDDMGNTIEVDLDNDIGHSVESLLGSQPQECMRVVYHMQDAIRGEPNAYKIAMPKNKRHSSKSPRDSSPQSSGKDRVVVAMLDPDLVVVALETADRAGLLLDIAKCLSRLDLDLQHTEAAVLQDRSLSIWRCQSKRDPSTVPSVVNDYVAEIWSILQAFLAKDSGVAAIKKRGLRVIRALVMPNGRLVGTTAAKINFRHTYKAAIVAIQKGHGKAKQNDTEPSLESESLADVILEVGDALVLQVSDDSHLLEIPPPDFYDKLAAAAHGGNGSDDGTKSGGFFGFGRKKSNGGQAESSGEINLDTAEMGQGDNADARKEREAIWADLQVIFGKNADGADGNAEFLTAMKVGAGSRLEGQTVVQAGIDSMPDVVLVSMERPVEVAPSDSGGTITSYTAIALSEAMLGGDVLWFSCQNANAVGDLRKIPGLTSYQDDEVEKMKVNTPDRLLVQAVVARKGALVGKTVKDCRFRTRYGAAVIAIQREGRRVHDHPGNVKLQAGDVLLLEAGPSFLKEQVQKDRSLFTLASPVKDSAPPRMSMLIPALILTVGAYACFMAKVTQLIGCAMVAVILMVALGIMSQTEARDSIRWDIYLTIASAYGIGTALVNSGVASAVAGFLVTIGNAIGMGDAGLLGAVYLGTVLISQLVANNAAAALIFPIAMDAAESTGTDLELMSYTIMLAASAAFMTPFGYQTNLMVMGPGGYKTSDFLIFGTPMQIVLLFASTIYLVTPLWICWLVSFCIFVAAAVYRVTIDRRQLYAVKSKKTS